MRGLPQDARPRGRPVPGFLRLRRRLWTPQGGLVRRHVRRRLRGGTARTRRALAGACHGSASGPRRTPASRSPWSSTSITSSRAARSCRPPRTRTTRSTTPGGGPTGSSAARSRPSPGASPRPGSTSRTPSRTGSSPTSTGPTAWRPRSTEPGRRAELDDVGLVRMLGPEQVERKVNAVFGKRWGKLQDQMAILYGGIDSQEVTERAADPSGAMGAIQRLLSNDVACQFTLRDFALKPPIAGCSRASSPASCPAPPPRPTRRSAGPSSTCTSSILGRHDAADSEEVARTFDLFAGTVADAEAAEGPRRPRDLPRPGQRPRRPRRPALHHPRLAGRGHLPAPTTRIPLRVTVMRRDFLKQCALAGLGLAVPLRFPRPTRAEIEGRRLSGPLLCGPQRLGRLGHHLPDGPQGRSTASTACISRATSRPAAPTRSPRPRSTSRAG